MYLHETEHISCTHVSYYSCNLLSHILQARYYKLVATVTDFLSPESLVSAVSKVAKQCIEASKQRNVVKFKPKEEKFPVHAVGLLCLVSYSYTQPTPVFT